MYVYYFSTVPELEFQGVIISVFNTLFSSQIKDGYHSQLLPQFSGVRNKLRWHGIVPSHVLPCWCIISYYNELFPGPSGQGDINGLARIPYSFSYVVFLHGCMCMCMWCVCISILVWLGYSQDAIEWTKNHTEIPIYFLSLYLIVVFYVPGVMGEKAYKMYSGLYVVRMQMQSFGVHFMFRIMPAKYLNLKLNSFVDRRHRFALWNLLLCSFSIIGCYKTLPTLLTGTICFSSKAFYSFVFLRIHAHTHNGLELTPPTCPVRAKTRSWQITMGKADKLTSLVQALWWSYVFRRVQASTSTVLCIRCAPTPRTGTCRGLPGCGRRFLCSARYLNCTVGIMLALMNRFW